MPQWKFDLPVWNRTSQGKEKCTLTDVNLFGRFNLLSITKLLLKGWTMTGSHPNGIVLTNGGKTIHFNIGVRTKYGILYVVKLERRNTNAWLAKPEESLIVKLRKEAAIQQGITCASVDKEQDSVDDDLFTCKSKDPPSSVDPPGSAICEEVRVDSEKHEVSNDNDNVAKCQSSTEKVDLSDAKPEKAEYFCQIFSAGPHYSLNSIENHATSHNAVATNEKHWKPVEASLIVAQTKPKAITVSKAHDALGHMGEAEIRAICKHFGQELTKRGMKICINCGKAKAKQLAVTQHNEDHEIAGADGRRFFIDLSSVKFGKEKKKPTARSYWMLVVEEETQMKWSVFLKTKKEMGEAACKLMMELSSQGLNIKFVRLDNAKENEAFAALANGKEWKLGIKFEFTGARTPQRNALAEVGFRTLWARTRAILDGAMVPEEDKYLLYREAIGHATTMDGLCVREINGQRKSRYAHIFGTEPKLKLPLRTWGEAGIIKVTGNVKGKLANRGTEAMFVGYASNHASDTYRMYSTETNAIPPHT